MGDYIICAESNIQAMYMCDTILKWFSIQGR